MRKKYSIIFICLVMITLNAICLNWAIQQERMKELAVTTASDRKQILSLLLGNMQMHYTYSECQLPDIILIDKLKNEITLSSIIADKRKLVLKFSPQNCYPCIEFSMSCLEKFALSIPNIKEEDAFYKPVIVNADYINKQEVNMTENVGNGDVATYQNLMADQLIEAYADNKLKNPLKEIAAKLNEESNPVVMLVKYRE